MVVAFVVSALLACTDPAVQADKDALAAFDARVHLPPVDNALPAAPVGAIRLLVTPEGTWLDRSAVRDKLVDPEGTFVPAIVDLTHRQPDGSLTPASMTADPRVLDALAGLPVPDLHDRDQSPLTLLVLIDPATPRLRALQVLYTASGSMLVGSVGVQNPDGSVGAQALGVGGRGDAWTLIPASDGWWLTLDPGTMALEDVPALVAPAPLATHIVCAEAECSRAVATQLREAVRLVGHRILVVAVATPDGTWGPIGSLYGAVPEDIATVALGATTDPLEPTYTESSVADVARHARPGDPNLELLAANPALSGSIRIRVSGPLAAVKRGAAPKNHREIRRCWLERRLAHPDGPVGDIEYRRAGDALTVTADTVGDAALEACVRGLVDAEHQQLTVEFRP